MRFFIDNWIDPREVINRLGAFGVIKHAAAEFFDKTEILTGLWIVYIELDGISEAE